MSQKEQNMVKVDFNSKTTFFAPAQRGDLSVVKKQFDTINNVELIDQVFSKVPLMFQILNKHRQIIYINELLRKDLELKGINIFLGYRPGEVLQCKNAYLETGGCGTSKHCQYCGIINSIITSHKTQQLHSQEAIFESEINGKTEATTYKVSSKPFVWKNEVFTIVSFENINDKKRKEQLERTFFHDLMNKVTSISGLSEILEMEETTHDNQFVKMIKRGIYDLADEINFQRNLINAEKDELVVNMNHLNSIDLLNQMKENFFAYESISNKTINIHPESSDFDFKSDKVLINRILNNLIKNSLEAIYENETVTIGANIQGDNFEFWVQNHKVLSEEIKAKIFKRSFSTKGEGRGIGTYSVKLFTEKYLNGKAYFTSDPENGTIFFVKFPF